MIVYHGSTEVISTPDVGYSFRNLDFGKGFYVTSVQEQAERWARRKSKIKETKEAIVTVYECADGFGDLNVLDFADDLEKWLYFVCKCRDGDSEYEQYDIIIGKVADDKVYRVVDMYKRGIWDKDRALQEMKVYETYDQIAFISQKAIERCLKFKKSFEVEKYD